MAYFSQISLTDKIIKGNYHAQQVASYVRACRHPYTMQVHVDLLRQLCGIYHETVMGHYWVHLTEWLMLTYHVSCDTSAHVIHHAAVT